MIGIISKLVVMFFILTVIYVGISVVSRIQKRDKLKAEYDDMERNISQEDFIEEGLVEHNKRTRRRLALKIYIFPAAIAAILIFLAHTGS
ncbi:MAG: hypothetical protein EX271_12095 [Acidimicrobiales bacterium]|nr:hypothetical protein [Hyphomonadaceae bacterium]RZV36597.1 MAG: hypothetical protein EX271_12095 [Acidimicrobiales bacterium]